MAGQLCSGSALKNAKVKDSKAYCEGMQWRAQGTALAYPVTDNPHAVESDAYTAWAAGWTFADDAAGGPIDTTATCCQITGTISA